MAVIDDLGAKILAALEGVLAPIGQSGSAAAKTAAKTLATGLVRVASDRASGAISDAEAKQYVDLLANGAWGTLMGQLAIAEANAKAAVKAAFQALTDFGLAAFGLGWADPIVNSLIANL